MELHLSPQLPDFLIAWFQTNARVLPWRSDREPYHIWLSEIMLQQTRVEAVKAYYLRFLSVLPTIADLAEADPELLHKLWEGLGYYSRVRNLQKAARCIMEEFGGVFPNSYEAIRALPGIGPYTAGAICSIAYDMPTPAVDGNVLRVISRLTCLHESISKQTTKQAVTQALERIYPAKAGIFTQSLMELGATVCVPNGAPQCNVCPLQTLCSSYQEGTWADYPIKDAKRPRTVEERTVFVLTCGERQAVCKRPSQGLLADLWEYPNVIGKLSREEALKRAEAWGCEPIGLTMQLERTHIFTHVQWNMRCYYITCRSMPENWTWATPHMLEKEIALPTAFRIFRI